MPFQIIQNDITKVKADVIVNTANPCPVIGNGTDSAIYHAAGKNDLLTERKKIGDITPGQAAATPAFALSAKHIIHTVAPTWIDGRHHEREILRSCYVNSLSLAAELNAGSIAFPLIATGKCGFPKDEALNIAIAEIGGFLRTHDMTVILVVFDRKSFALSGQLAGRIDEYIDTHGVGLAEQPESGRKSGRHQHMEKGLLCRRIFPADAANKRSLSFGGIPDAAAASPVDMASPTAASPVDMTPPAAASPIAPPAPAPFNVAGKSLDEVLDSVGESFQQKLFQLIDASGMDDVTVYKKANIDRKVFSRIRCKKDYRPKKKTAVAFAIALELDLPATLDLLSRAEIAFSPNSRFDLIVTYFITNKIYDIYTINSALFKYGQPVLGE